MNSALRAFGAIAVFGLFGPLLGLAMLLLVNVAVSGGHLGPINWSDFTYSVVELGLPAAIAGVVFSAAFYWLSGRSIRISRRSGRAALAASAMVLIFGLPFMEKWLLYSLFSINLGLIALLAGATGAMMGAALPAPLLVFRTGDAG